MKLSFSLNSRPSSSSSPPPPPNPPNPNFPSDDHHREFITEFTPTPPSPPHPHFTIPPLPNTWNPQSSHPTTKSVSDMDLDLDLDSKLLKKLHEDILRLPDHNGAEEFADVPVEGYGRAVLAGYGWREGRGVGKNVKEDVKVKEYRGNVGRCGLGFVPKTD